MFSIIDQRWKEYEEEAKIRIATCSIIKCKNMSWIGKLTTGIRYKRKSLNSVAFQWGSSFNDLDSLENSQRTNLAISYKLIEIFLTVKLENWTLFLPRILGQPMKLDQTFIN